MKALPVILFKIGLIFVSLVFGKCLCCRHLTYFYWKSVLHNYFLKYFGNFLKKVVVCYFYWKIISGAVIQKVTKIENNNVKTKKKQEQNKIAFSWI